MATAWARPQAIGLGRRSGWLLAGAGLLLAAALFARIMRAPVGRDENMFFTIPMLAGEGDPYRDFGFNHLPNLLLLAGPLMRMADEPFLAGRLLVFLAWLLTAAVMAAHGVRATGSRRVAALGVLLLGTSPLLLNATGTLISNNFLPIPFALAGALMMFTALEGAEVRRGRVLLAGVLLAVAAGFKANYVFVVVPFAVAAFLVPRALPLAARLRQVVLPLLAGGLLGGAPTLLALARDPAGFLAHVAGYHRGPHVAHAAQSLDPALVRTPAERLQLALELWGSGGTLLAGFVVLVLAIMLVGRGWRPRWEVLATLALVGLGMLVSFVPTPSFPQYFSPPVAFLILLMLLLIGELQPGERAQLRPWLLGLAIAVVAIDGPRLARDLPALADPSGWTPSKVDRNAAVVAAAAGGRPVATLVPVYPVAGRAGVYPELAAGPFIYRVADLIPPEDRRHYRLVSPAALPAMLDRVPPGAVLLETDGALEAPLAGWALANGYREVALPEPDTKAGRLRLYVPGSPAGTSASSSEPPPSRAAASSAPPSATR
jgi:4-amino-4-deoxy-L-arabinose transferase-like glycosyltransferase